MESLLLLQWIPWKVSQVGLGTFVFLHKSAQDKQSTNGEISPHLVTLPK
jgi:hypothetical protein